MGIRRICSDHEQIHYNEKRGTQKNDNRTKVKERSEVQKFQSKISHVNKNRVKGCRNASSPS